MDGIGVGQQALLEAEIKAEQPPHQLQRNSQSVFGGFELSLRRRRDPLDIEIFSRWGHPVPCLPMIWVYGCADPMPMAIPFVMIELPLPKEIPKEFEQCGRDDLQIWMLVHASPKRAPCQKASHELVGEEKLDEVNLSHHAWMFGGLDTALVADPNLSIETVVNTGIFDAIGVSSTHQDLKCIETRGLPFDRLEPREVIVHGGGCFSPCNNMLQLDSSYIFHSFVSKSIGKRRRLDSTDETLSGAIILHVVPAHEQAEQHLRSLIDSATTLADICAALYVLDAAGFNTFDRMLEDCAPDMVLDIRSASKQQQDAYRRILTGDPSFGMLAPWCPPLKQIDEGGGGGGATSMDIVALAQQMMDRGYPDFDTNVEVLTSVNGNLELAVQFLSPC